MWKICYQYFFRVVRLSVSIFILSIIIFLLGAKIPVNEVDNVCNLCNVNNRVATNPADKACLAKRLYLDLPLFYVELATYPLAVSSHRIPLPTLTYHGVQNQYHKWLKILVTKGKWGISVSKLTCRACNCNASDRIFEVASVSFTLPLIRTLVITITGIAVIFIMGLYLGVLTVYAKNTWFDRLTGYLLIGLDAIPVFWVCTLLSIGLLVSDYQQHRLLWDEFSVQSNQLIILLALACYIYGGTAVFARVVRQQLIEIERNDYIRTAYAKGLSSWKVLWSHGLPNAIIPVLPLLGGTFPLLVSGSVVIEKVFDIPGMGSLILTAIYQGDTYVLVPACLLIGFFSWMGFTFTRWLTQKIDPKAINP